MRKIFFILALACSIAVLAQDSISIKRDHRWIKGLSFGPGVPLEVVDLKAGGVNGHIGYDFAKPINDRFAMGMYISGGAGFLREFHPYLYGKFDKYDNHFIDVTVSAGIMMEFGDLNKQPFLIGFCPATGIAFVDMDLVLPLEVRFGRVLKSNWYIMGQLAYYVSLAKETVTIEPSLGVGYNFGKKIKPKKKK